MHHISLMHATMQGGEIYVLSGSVQKIGQITGAIFTHRRMQIKTTTLPCQERVGAMVNSRSASMRSASGGGVLNNEDKVPPPNHGFTMHSAAVDGETLVVGMRWL